MKKIFVGLCLILFLNFVSLYAQDEVSPYDLSETELAQIKSFSDSSSIEKFAGQLFMVGLPTDISTYRRDSVIEKLIKTHKIGWAFVNTSTYWWDKNAHTETEMRNSIAALYEYVQKNAIESTGIPVGFAANFEGGTMSSIGSILSQPPEALTISSSGDPKLASYIGKMVGQQLHKLGIHVLFGPVLDLDENTDRRFITTIQNRVFAGSPNLVTNIASYYLTSVKESGIFTVAKHFPGYNNVLEDPNVGLSNSMPESGANISDLDRALSPYRILAPNIDGVMTAHIKLNMLPDVKEVTFSQTIVNDLFRNETTTIDGIDIDGLGFKDKISITDDLADMKAIRDYMNSDSDIDWDTIVVNAFTAGHDILLFSSIENSENPRNPLTKYEDFSVDKLSEIIDNFIEYH